MTPYEWVVVVGSVLMVAAILIAYAIPRDKD